MAKETKVTKVTKVTKKAKTTKTTRTRTAPPTFYEVVINGSPKAVRGLLTGLALGLGDTSRQWFHRDHDIVDPTVPGSARRTAERLHLLPVSEVRVVVSGTLGKALRSLKRKISASGACEIESIDRVKQARVELKYTTYARRYDNEVQTLLRDIPRGVQFENPVHEIETDPHARGAEAYAPAHDFESNGGGILVGRFDLIVDLRDRLEEHPLITCEELELVTS